jgi:DNA-binding response OmpR family regulator
LGGRGSPLPPSIHSEPSRFLATLRAFPSVQTGPAKTILICEDDRSLRQLVRVVLGDGYRFVEADTGREALDLAYKLRPDLIILDLMLPGASGFDVLTELRAKLPGDETRVIVMSAWGHADEAALNAGADRFVAKPFEADELTSVVSEVLGEARG